MAFLDGDNFCKSFAKIVPIQKNYISALQSHFVNLFPLRLQNCTWNVSVRLNMKMVEIWLHHWAIFSSLWVFWIEGHYICSLIIHVPILSVCIEEAGFFSLLFHRTFGWGTKVYVQNQSGPSNGVLHHFCLTGGSTFTSQDYNLSSLVYVSKPVRAIWRYLPSEFCALLCCSLSQLMGTRNLKNHSHINGEQ